MFIVQEYACHIIAKVLNEKKNLSHVLTNTFQETPSLSTQERAAIQDISYGCLRFYGLINTILTQLIHKPIDDQVIRHLLLVSLYQLIYTKAKTHAIVHSAVENASLLDKAYAKGFINAILRGFLRNQSPLIDEAKKNPVAQYSHPAWWIKRMQSAYPQDWETLLAANNTHPPLTLRVNRRQITSSQYLHLLQSANIGAKLLGPYTIQLDTPRPVKELPYFFDGYVSVQDWGAQFAAELLDLQDGMHVLDACAAPGGKTGHMLEIADIHLTAIDNDPIRLKRVEENLTRLKLCAKVICADASHPETFWDKQGFDRILADVPCSASGVVKRHPDIKWLRKPDDFAKFATQQAKMLDQLWDCLNKHGKLLFATCSVFPEENIAQVQAFISRHPDAKHLDGPFNHYGQLLPSLGHDGFYYALLQKM